MRVQKRKRHRKIVNFYSACYGFRPPFRVLCDGTFVHHLISNGLLPADKALQNCLSDPVKLFTTRCTLSELKRLGDSYSEDLKAAKSLLFARCDHEGRKSAEACITEVIGKTNPGHFFVATQDADLREKLQEIPGVPIIFGLRKALILHRLSASQLKFVKNSEEERAHMTREEFNLLSKRVNKKLVTGESNNSGDEEDKNIDDQRLDVQKLDIARRDIEVKDKVQFKRKKAKGPNPLSCKKKKNHENSRPALEKTEDDKKSGRGRRTRKRKRSQVIDLSPRVSVV